MAISKIGPEPQLQPPALIGLAEVENDRVLADLVKSTHLHRYNYGFVHYDSPDERGIDVALLYNQDYFILENSEAIPLYVENEHGARDYTRDILKVSGYLGQEKIHLLINHWPSRHTKSDTTGYKRITAAKRVVQLIDDLRQSDPRAKIIIMGDFNDNPKNNSIQLLKKEGVLYNPMEQLFSFNKGSVVHGSKWMLFDQILMTTNFLDPDEKGLKFTSAAIFNKKFLTQNTGKFKSQPFRTYAGKKYLGGFSDHFPVYVQVKK